MSRDIYNLLKNYAFQCVQREPRVSVMGLGQVVEALFVCQRRISEEMCETRMREGLGRLLRGETDDLVMEYEIFKKNSNCLDFIDIARKAGNECCGELKRIVLGTISGDQHCDGSQIDGLDSADKAMLDAVIGYLQLMFNSKNQIAIAFCITHLSFIFWPEKKVNDNHEINMPIRGITRQVFTTLKYVSRSIKVSIYQLIISLVHSADFVKDLNITTDKEGVDVNMLMNEHVRNGLADFLKIMHNLHSCLYEETLSKAKERVIEYISDLIPEHSRKPIIDLITEEIDECSSQSVNQHQSQKLISSVFNACAQRLSLLQTQCSPMESNLSQCDENTQKLISVRMFYKSPRFVNALDVIADSPKKCESPKPKRKRLSVMKWSLKERKPIPKKTKKVSPVHMKSNKKKIITGQRSIKEFFKSTNVKCKDEPKRNE